MDAGIVPAQLRQLIIEPVLEDMGGRLNSPAAVRLLMGTAAVETRCGHWLRQVRGPALGIYQMEPATHKDVRAWIYRERELRMALHRAVRGELPTEALLVQHLGYATAMARLFYWRVPYPLPDAEDLPGLARYWKAHWNTPLGAGTEQQFIDAAQVHGV